MLFNSIEFIIFFSIFFPIFLFSRGSARKFTLLLASYFFYAWWDVRFLSLIILSTIINFILGQRSASENGKPYMVAGVVINLGFLGFFKYFNFFLESIDSLLILVNSPFNFPVYNIILPVGISFFTFQGLSYVLDVYFGRIKPEKSILDFSVYIALFPQLVAGPIVRASLLLPQLKKIYHIKILITYRALTLF